MLFHVTTLASILVFALAALADRRHQHTPRFINGIERSANVASGEPQYNPRWAGALWSKDNGTFTSVTGTFNIPVLSGPSGSAASVWAGIDGYTCKGRGPFQAGVLLSVDDNNETSFYAWCEWYPDFPYYFNDFDINAGDIIKVNVTSFNQTSGLAMIENLSNNQQKSMFFNSTYPLCQQSAEWIVEDFTEYVTGGAEQAPFANFHEVVFADTEASGPVGTYTAEGATIVDIQENGQTLTSSSIDGSTITVEYV